MIHLGTMRQGRAGIESTRVNGMNRRETIRARTHAERAIRRVVFDRPAPEPVAVGVIKHAPRRDGIGETGIDPHAGVVGDVYACIVHAGVDACGGLQGHRR